MIWLVEISDNLLLSFYCFDQLHLPLSKRYLLWVIHFLYKPFYLHWLWLCTDMNRQMVGCFEIYTSAANSSNNDSHPQKLKTFSITNISTSLRSHSLIFFSNCYKKFTVKNDIYIQSRIIHIKSPICQYIYSKLILAFDNEGLYLLTYVKYRGCVRLF